VSRGTVVITGASSGIGEATARHLAGLGFLVRAGVRKDADAERLAGPGIEPLIIDVTDQASIDRAAGEITGPLAGLVNNAGVAVTGPLEFLPIDELRHQLEINVIGQVAVTQAFLPAIREGMGRIVFMSSIGGKVALPLAGAYAGSKFAIEAISDSLRRELRPWGIQVSAIEPGAVQTPIWEKGAEAADGLMQDMPAEVMDHYGEVIDALRAEAKKFETDATDPQEVADAVAHALTASRPKTRYPVGRDAKIRSKLARVMPDRVMDAAIGRALKQRKRS
jgi:NAD(P)-dependent dehydrogenase (short-subunit alcohol dehydrogenase family)